MNRSHVAGALAFAVAGLVFLAVWSQDGKTGIPGSTSQEATREIPDVTRSEEEKTRKVDGAARARPGRVKVKILRAEEPAAGVRVLLIGPTTIESHTGADGVAGFDPPAGAIYRVKADDGRGGAASGFLNLDTVGSAPSENTLRLAPYVEVIVTLDAGGASTAGIGVALHPTDEPKRRGSAARRRADAGGSARFLVAPDTVYAVTLFGRLAVPLAPPFVRVADRPVKKTVRIKIFSRPRIPLSKLRRDR